MRKTKKEIIDETYAFYTEDPSRRGWDPQKEECVFVAAGGQRCAIGRCLTLQSARDAQDAGAYNLATIATMCATPAEFQESYKGHEDAFWAVLQDFHDYGELWAGAHDVCTPEAEERRKGRRERWLANAHVTWDHVIGIQGPPGQKEVA